MTDYNRLAGSGSLMQTVHKLHSSRQHDYTKSINDPSLAKNISVDAPDMLSTDYPITLNINGTGLGDGVDKASRDGGGSP